MFHAALPCCNLGLYIFFLVAYFTGSIHPFSFYFDIVFLFPLSDLLLLVRNRLAPLLKRKTLDDAFQLVFLRYNGVSICNIRICRQTCFCCFWVLWQKSKLFPVQDQTEKWILGKVFLKQSEAENEALVVNNRLAKFNKQMDTQNFSFIGLCLWVLVSSCLHVCVCVSVWVCVSSYACVHLLSMQHVFGKCWCLSKRVTLYHWRLVSCFHGSVCFREIFNGDARYAYRSRSVT